MVTAVAVPSNPPSRLRNAVLNTAACSATLRTETKTTSLVVPSGKASQRNEKSVAGSTAWASTKF